MTYSEQVKGVFYACKTTAAKNAGLEIPLFSSFRSLQKSGRWKENIQFAVLTLLFPNLRPKQKSELPSLLF